MQQEIFNFLSAATPQEPPGNRRDTLHFRLRSLLPNEAGFPASDSTPD